MVHIANPIPFSECDELANCLRYTNKLFSQKEFRAVMRHICTQEFIPLANIYLCRVTILFVAFYGHDFIDTFVWGFRDQMRLLNFLRTTQEGDQQRFKRESQDPLDNIADCMWPTIQGLGVLHDSCCDSVLSSFPSRSSLPLLLTIQFYPPSFSSQNQIKMFLNFQLYYIF